MCIIGSYGIAYLISTAGHFPEKYPHWRMERDSHAVLQHIQNLKQALLGDRMLQSVLND
jgi:hypothetical protein